MNTSLIGNTVITGAEVYGVLQAAERDDVPVCQRSQDAGREERRPCGPVHADDTSGGGGHYGLHTYRSRAQVSLCH